MLFLGRIYICTLPLVLWGFSQHLPAKYRWRLKKVLPSERGVLALCYMVNPPWLLHYVHKTLDEGLRKQLSEQNPLISPGLYISIGWQKRIDGARAPWSLILLVITVVCVYCFTQKYLKKLKMTKQDFLSHFYHLWHFDWGAPCPPPPPLATPMIVIILQCYLWC